MSKDIMDIEVVDAEIVSYETPKKVSSTDECVPGVLCSPKDYFEMIQQCSQCGKIA